MKHRQHHSTRFAPHVQAVLDLVGRISTARPKVTPGKRVLIAFRIAGRALSILVSAVVPRGQGAAFYTAKKCARVRAMCAGHARAAA